MSKTKKRKPSIPKKSKSSALGLDLHDLAGATGQALGLPGSCYGADAFKEEQAKLFPTTWSAIGLACDIPEHGDVVPLHLAGTPLLAARQKDGSVAVFYNICRHRGMPLVAAPTKKLSRLVCPWHAWCYRLDGALERTPRVGGDGANVADGIDTNSLGLKQVRSKVWRDLIFVNLDGRAPDIEADLTPIEGLLGNPPTDLIADGRWTGSYPGNWKISIEGGIEDYHLPHGHPQILPGLKRRDVEIATGAIFAASLARETREPASDYAPLPVIDYGDANGPDVRLVNIFPTGVLATTPTHLFIGAFTPDGPDRTKLDFSLHWPKGAFGSKAKDKARAAELAGWIEIIGQDDIFVEGVRSTAPYRDAAGIRTRFSPYWVGAVLHFQRLWADRMTADIGKKRNASTS